MQTPHRYPVIFNPNARGQKASRSLRFLMKRANRFALYATNHEREASELAARFARDGEPVVIAVGGDGTVNAVVQGLAGTATALGVLPAGTMNVFARELGIPCAQFDKCFEIIESRLSLDVDLFETNGMPFVQMAGVGFDAMVIEETKWETKKMLGPLAYLLSAVRLLGETPPHLEVICADGRRETGVALLAGNGTLYGGQFRLFRKADNRDSKLDILLFKEAGYRMVLDSLKGLAMGGVDLSSSVSYFQCSEFQVKIDREVPVEVDGELIGRFSEVNFVESARRLHVLAPETPTSGFFADVIGTLLQWPRRSAEILPATRSL